MNAKYCDAAATRARSRRWASLVISVCAALLMAETSNAIIDGEPDGRRHPFVGLIVYQLEVDGPWYAPPGGNAILVSATVAVTAGHVLETPLSLPTMGIIPVQIGVVFEEKPADISRPPDLPPFWRLVPTASVHVAASVAWHPQLFASPDAPHDIGVIIFKHPIKGRPTARIPQPGLFDILLDVLEPEVQLVGYGGFDPTCCPPVGGYRKSGSAPVVELTDELLVTAQLNERDVNGGPGDSGGPAFLGHHLLLGVLSSLGFPPDESQPRTTTFNRTDSVSSCLFLSNYLKLNCRPIGRDR
jgi:hypothetical protein